MMNKLNVKIEHKCNSTTFINADGMVLEMTFSSSWMLRYQMLTSVHSTVNSETLNSSLCPLDLLLTDVDH